MSDIGDIGLPAEDELRAELAAMGLVSGGPTRVTVDRMREDLNDHIANVQLKNQIAADIGIAGRDELATQRMRTRLTDHISEAASSTIVSERRRWRPLVRLVGIAAVVVAVVSGVFLLRSGNEVAAGPLGELAQAVYSLPETEFGGVRMERVKLSEGIDDSAFPISPGVEEVLLVRFVEEQTIEYAADGTVRLSTVFLSADPMVEVDDAVAEFVGEFFRVGEVDVTVIAPEDARTEQFDLSGEVETVRKRINTHLANFGDPEVPYLAQLFALVSSEYHVQYIKPSERATLIEILATTEGVEASREGSVTVATGSYVDVALGLLETQLRFDASGWLIGVTTLTVDGIPEWNLESGAIIRRTTTPAPTTP